MSVTKENHQLKYTVKDMGGNVIQKGDLVPTGSGNGYTFTSTEPAQGLHQGTITWDMDDSEWDWNESTSPFRSGTLEKIETLPGTPGPA